MLHLNGHTAAVVDVETTGTVPGYHDIIQICVLVLDDNLDYTSDYFYINMKPKRPENMKLNHMTKKKLGTDKIIKTGVDPDYAQELFIEWYDGLNLPMNRRLAPMASNFVFDQGFVKDWLGPEMYDERFHFHYRDTQPVALYLNDRAAIHGEDYPFERIGVEDLGAKFGIVNEDAHDALQDCVATSKIYKAMLTMNTPVHMQRKFGASKKLLDELLMRGWNINQMAEATGLKADLLGMLMLEQVEVDKATSAKLSALGTEPDYWYNLGKGASCTSSDSESKSSPTNPTTSETPPAQS